MFGVEAFQMFRSWAEEMLWMWMFMAAQERRAGGVEIVLVSL